MIDKRLKIVLPIAILIAAAIVTLIMLKSRAPVETRPPREYIPLVRVIAVEPSTHQLEVTGHGTVRPRTEAALVSEVAGQVMEVAPSFAAGGFFRKGDVLVRLDPRDYELAIVTARGQVAQAKVRVEMEEAQAKVARAEWEKLGRGEAPPLATRELQLQEARASLASAEAALERAGRNLARTRIKAPFVGRVKAKLVDVGQYLSPGVPVANVFAVDYAEVPIPIPDMDVAYLDVPLDFDANSHSKQGPPVLLTAEFAGKKRQWRGEVVRVEGQIDPVSRTVNVVAQVEDPYGRKEEGDPTPLAAGLFVDAVIFGREVEGAVVLPRSALRGKDEVLVLDDESRLRFRKVDVLRVARSEVVITGGLEANEKVCVSLLEAVTDGMKVRTSGSEEGAS